MCELLALSANVPTDICFSFTGLMQRGGMTGPHKDGWGIGLYEGKACRLFHDPHPSAWSKVAALIQDYSIKSHISIAHIRKANRGRVCLANTHPFARELWGTTWVFAHNGQLRGIKQRQLKHYQPVGTTDSEYAFCWIMDQIRKKYSRRPKNENTLYRFIQDMAVDIDELGVFNFMLSDSRQLYVYCSNRMCWLTRRHPFGKARLIDTGKVVDFRKLTTPRDIVSIIASRELTDNETWNNMRKKELVIFRDGQTIEFNQTR